jgi:hypothetical protein
MNRLFCCVVLALLGGMVLAAAEELVVSLSITVDPVKLNGSPWDGLPSIGGRILMPSDSNAPDIAVCIVLATGAPECQWRTERRQKLSFCPNSTKCTISGIPLRSLPVGLLFLDVDLIRHDLIDFVILTGEPVVAGETEKVELNLRAAMANLTPGLTEADRQRRLRKATILPIAQCMGASAKCDLTQSVFHLEHR